MFRAETESFQSCLEDNRDDFKNTNNASEELMPFMKKRSSFDLNGILDFQPFQRMNGMLWINEFSQDNPIIEENQLMDENPWEGESCVEPENFSAAGFENSQNHLLDSGNRWHNDFENNYGYQGDNITNPSFAYNFTSPVMNQRHNIFNLVPNGINNNNNPAYPFNGVPVNRSKILAYIDSRRVRKSSEIGKLRKTYKQNRNLRTKGVDAISISEELSATIKNIDFSSVTVAELKRILRMRGILPLSKKEDMINQIKEEQRLLSLN
jgi:hypothetical protein